MKITPNHTTKYFCKSSGDIDPSFVITHSLPLEQAPHGYEIFKHKKDNCIKVVLKPGQTA